MSSMDSQKVYEGRILDLQRAYAENGLTGRSVICSDAIELCVELFAELRRCTDDSCPVYNVK